MDASRGTNGFHNPEGELERAALALFDLCTASVSEEIEPAQAEADPAIAERNGLCLAMTALVAARSERSLAGPARIMTDTIEDLAAVLAGVLGPIDDPDLVCRVVDDFAEAFNDQLERQRAFETETAEGRA